MGKTISEAIGEDHQAFDDCYDRIKASTDEVSKTRWRNQLTWTVARHAISEELTMYPAMEKHLGDEGKRLTATDKAQHQAVKNQLAELQDMSSTAPAFHPKLDALMATLHEHIAHESDEDMPRLEAILPRAESEALARSFERTKLIVPTRSHPGAPTTYVLENLAALLAAPIDRFMDLTREFPTEVERKEEKL